MDIVAHSFDVNDISRVIIYKTNKENFLKIMEANPHMTVLFGLRDCEENFFKDIFIAGMASD